jgi:hypothetical protein
MRVSNLSITAPEMFLGASAIGLSYLRKSRSAHGVATRHHLSSGISPRALDFDRAPGRSGQWRLRAEATHWFVSPRVSRGTKRIGEYTGG